MKKHPLIQNKIDGIVRSAAEDVNALTRAHEMARQHHFWLCLDCADYIVALQDWLFEFDHHRNESIKIPVDRYHVTLRIDIRHKEILRPVLLHAFDRYAKTYHVIRHGCNGYHLIETWKTTWDIILNNFGNPGAENSLVIEFYRPAQPGERINGTCTIGWRTNEHTDRHLTLTCTKPAD